MNLSTLYTVIAAMFVLLVCGYVMRKIGVIDDTASKNLTALVVKLGQPALIISSLLSVEFSTDMLKSSGIVFGVGLLIYAVLAVPAYFIGRACHDKDEGRIIEFSLLFTNCGFIGLPVLEALFGETGLFLGAIYQLVFYFAVWSWGTAIFTRGRSDMKLSARKIFLNHGMIAAYIGIALFIINIWLPMPAFFTKSLSYLSGICTPITLIIAGSLIAKLSLRQIFLSPKMYLQSLVKLFLIPLCVAVVAALCGLDHEYVMFFVAVTALPSASMVAMFAETYDTKQSFASLIVGVSTLFCVVSIPIVLKLSEVIINFLRM